MIKARRREFRADEGFKAVDLIKYADGHLRSARVLFASDFLCLDSAGYLGHLALELILKAGILYLHGSFEDEHDLSTLREQLEVLGVTCQLSGEQENVLYVFGQYKDLRYPNAKRPISVGSTEGDGLKTLCNTLLSQLPPALVREFLQADDGEKGGRILMTRHGGPSVGSPSGSASARE